jgi:integrase/recombinase XerC
MFGVVSGTEAERPADKALDAGELAKFVQSAQEMREPAWVAPLLTLYAATGARLAELLGVTARDVSEDGRLVQVIGKRQKARACVVVGEDARARLLAAVAEARARGGEDAPVFVTKRGGRVGRRAVQVWVDKLMRRAGIKQTGRCVHSLRHTYVTRLIEHDVPVMKVAAAVGHADVRTTMRYTHLKAGDLAREIGEKMEAVEI